MRVTKVMIRCAFLEVHVEEEFAGFEDEDDIEDVSRTSPFSKKVRWERVGRGRGRAQDRGRGLGRGNAVDRNASGVGNNDAQPLTWDVVNLGESASEPRESIPLRERDVHFP